MELLEPAFEDGRLERDGPEDEMAGCRIREYIAEPVYLSDKLNLTRSTPLNLCIVTCNQHH